MKIMIFYLSMIVGSLTNIYYFTVVSQPTKILFFVQVGFTCVGLIALMILSRKKDSGHVDKLYKTSKTLTTKSNDVGTSFGSLLESYGDQVNQISRLSSSFEEISQMSRNTEEVISSTKESYADSVKVAHEGKMVIENLAKSFKELKVIQDEDAKGNNEIIDTLRKFSEIFDGVKNKTMLINDVVFQTKLLSFNASVEAARAGEHGKGFAVVAEEIGNLAAMSGKTSNQINEMIEENSAFIQQTINHSSQKLKEVIARSSSVSEKVAIDVAQCVKQFNGIISNIDGIDSQIASIEKASAEQRLGIEDGSSALHSLDHLATVNQSKINETMGTNEQIMTLIEGLNTIASDIFEDVLGLKIEPVECTDKRINGGYFSIVDVRREDEFIGDLNHIPNAQLHTLGDRLTSTLNTSDKGARYLFVCRSGGRSSRAAREAQSLGFKNVFNMTGGMLEYRKRVA